MPTKPAKPKKNPFVDHVAAKDHVAAGTAPRGQPAVPARFPCPKCGKETKDAGDGARRCFYCKHLSKDYLKETKKPN